MLRLRWGGRLRIGLSYFAMRFCRSRRGDRLVLQFLFRLLLPTRICPLFCCGDMFGCGKFSGGVLRSGALGTALRGGGFGVVLRSCFVFFAFAQLDEIFFVALADGDARG